MGSEETGESSAEFPVRLVLPRATKHNVAFVPNAS